VRRAPQVTFVAPYVGLTNTAGQAIIRGSGFNAITTQKVKVRHDGRGQPNGGTTTRRLRRATLRSRGTYPVFVENSTGASTRGRGWRSSDAPAFPDEAITRSGVAIDLIYDAERKTIYAPTPTARSTATAHQQAWSADSWRFPDLRGLRAVAGRKEIVAIDKQQVLHVDPSP